LIETNMPFRTQLPTLMRVLAVAAAAVACSSAQAQSTWNLVTTGNSGGMCTQGGSNSNNYNNNYGCNNGTSTVTVSAWSTATGNGRYVTPATGAIDSTNNAGDVHQFLSGSGYANSRINNQGTSGFGAANRDEGANVSGAPNHAFDSVPSGADMMLLDFGSTDVVLSKIGIGWWSGNADVSLMRWRGDKSAGLNTGSTAVGGNQLLKNNLWNAANPTVAGWELVGSYADLTSDNSNPYGGQARDTNATAASSWWLISTFNTALTGGSTTCRNAANTGDATCSMSNNQFKLNYIQTTAPMQVPVPGSLALAGLGLLAAYAASRRRAA
jgi:PEP-CTERM motif